MPVEAVEADEPGVDAVDLEKEGAIVLFDGVCNLCNGWVQFLLKNEAVVEGRAPMRFASIQSPAGRALMECHGLEPGALGSVVWVADGSARTHSGAVLAMCGRLRMPWPLLRVFWVVPSPLRDLGYGLIARLRYRVFGRSDVCWVPTPETRARFIDTAV